MRFFYTPRRSVNILTEYVKLSALKTSCKETFFNSSSAWIDIDFEACKIPVEETSDYIKRTAVVEAHGVPSDTTVTRSKLGILSRYTISCRYERSRNVSTGDGYKGTAVADIETDYIGSLSDYNLTMKFYEDATFDESIASPEVEVS